MSKFIHRALTSAAIICLATQPALSQSGDAKLDEVIVFSSPLKKSADEIISQTHVILDDDINKNVGTAILVAPPCNWMPRMTTETAYLGGSTKNFEISTGLHEHQIPTQRTN